MNPILVKRYRNRKLYSQAKHTYITLQDVFQMAKDSVLFVIQDSMGKDITEDIILQSVLIKSKSDPSIRQKILELTK